MSDEHADKQALREISEQLGAARAWLDRVIAAGPATWTLDDLRRELDRWEQELRSATNDLGQHYPPDTISTHTGHSRQFVRWLAGQWQPAGPPAPAEPTAVSKSDRQRDLARRVLDRI